uniref:Endoplasmin homolog n=1 Tax=Nicotiana tabacum TaxID=4097 RepID=A0A1S4A5S9_TOBAC|nr:PREDICTED: endoplasmin homolog [Nicotiana tabacum]
MEDRVREVLRLAVGNLSVLLCDRVRLVAFAKLWQQCSSRSHGVYRERVEYFCGSVSFIHRERDGSPVFAKEEASADYKVIVFKDEIDEYVILHLGEYKGKGFHDVSEDEFELENSFNKLAQRWKNILAEDNIDIKINHVLVDTLYVIVTSTYGLTAYLERLLQSQAILDLGKQTYMLNKRVLKINHKHSIIKELRSRVVKDPKDDNAKEIEKIMYGIASLTNGLKLTDLDSAAFHLYNLVQSTLKSCTTIITEEA